MRADDCHQGDDNCTYAFTQRWQRLLRVSNRICSIHQGQAVFSVLTVPSFVLTAQWLQSESSRQTVTHPMPLLSSSTWTKIHLTRLKDFGKVFKYDTLMRNNCLGKRNVSAGGRRISQGDTATYAEIREMLLVLWGSPTGILDSCGKLQ